MQTYTRHLAGPAATAQDGTTALQWGAVSRGPGAGGTEDTPAEGDPGPGDRAASLLRTIETQIIPRLLMAHCHADSPAAPSSRPLPVVGPAEVAVLTDIVLGRVAGSAADYVRARRAEGLDIESMYLELLAPTAERLGALWEADLCDFTEVTVGLWRLQQLVNEYSSAFQRGEHSRRSGHRALLAPAPGSQHNFGLLMVVEFFRRAGWDVWADPGADLHELTRTIGSSWYDLLGLSVGSECHVPQVASAILTLRQASLNPAVVIMVGGPVVGLLDNFVAQVGADATAGDARQAVAEAERLVAARYCSS